MPRRSVRSRTNCAGSCTSSCARRGRALRAQEPGEGGEAAARRAAGEVGVEIGQAKRTRLGIHSPGAGRASAVATQVLEEAGYEPYRDAAAGVRLRSARSIGLADQERELVCGVNHRLIEGVVRGLGNQTLGVALEPVPGECCVRLEPPR